MPAALATTLFLAAAPAPAPPPAPACRPLEAAPTAARLARGERVRLSDEWRCSRWAEVQEDALARARPDARARVVRVLRPWTQDDTPELVLLLEERRDARGGLWVRVRLPMRPNGTTGWVFRDRLGPYRIVTTALRIERWRLRATLFRGGRRLWSAPVGIGKRGTPTPAGRFYVRERLIPTNPRGLYGVFAFGTSAYSPTLSDWPGGGVIGIHGTNQPWLLPGRVSHGCVRVQNARIARLRRLMPLGTPIQIV
jgi:hypothetical protein